MSRINETSSDIAREVAQRELLRPNGKRADDAHARAPAGKVHDATATKGGDGVDARTPATLRLDASVQAKLRTTVAESSQTSPFESLLTASASQALPLRTVGMPLSLGDDASVAPELMAKLAQLEQGALVRSAKNTDATPRLLSATDKVRQALMLTLSDGVGVYANDKTNVPKMLAAALGESVYWETRQAAAQTNAQSVLFAHQKAFPMGMDVEALVQAVLRESYLLQNEILKDYADKVKFYNELKKKILAKLRDARTLHGTAKDGEPLPADFEFEMYNEEVWTRWAQRPAEEGSDNAGKSSGLPEDANTSASAGAGTGAGQAGADASDNVGEDGGGPDGAGDQTGNDETTQCRVVLGQTQTIAKNLSYAGSNSYDKFDAHRDAFLEEVLARLPTESWEREALAEQWRMQGFELKMAVRDTDKNNDYYFSDASGAVTLSHKRNRASFYKVETMRPDDTLETYVQRLVRQEADAFRLQVRRVEHKEINIEWIDYEINVPRFSLAKVDDADGRATSAPDDTTAESQGGTAAEVSDAELRSGGEEGPRDENGGRVLEDHRTNAPLVALPVLDDLPYSKEEMDAYAKSLEGQLSDASDDAQLANVDLQNALQKQQQVLQMMSNISKMLHDTAMSIIRKIGA